MMSKSLEKFIVNIIEKDETDRPIFVIDMDDLVEKFQQWEQCLPRIHPYYAMKCNDAPPVIEALAALGAGFDCASSTELSIALNAGASSENIVFANPCKTPSMICFAKNAGVDLTTIDCVGEVEKLKKYQPNARMLLRLKADDSASKYKLGNKFGVTLDEVDDVLSAAQKLDINIVGIAFHVGSDCHSADAFNSAIVMAAEVCSKLPSYGFKMQILDIGGGFPGDIDFNDPDNTFYRMARTINASLDLHFPRVRFPTLKIISEPGRYFVSSAFRLLTKVVGKRFIKDKKEVMYYMNDGLFGGFLIKFWEPEMIKVKPMLTLTTLESRKEYRSTLWGPTCDSSDVIVEGIQLKEMEVGEYFVTSNFGAYTVPLTTPFNGMDKPIYKVFYGHKSAFLESPINDILITNGV